MLEKQKTEPDLVLELKELRDIIEVLKREKADLEILLETTMAHADFVELQLQESHQKLQAEIIERQLAETKLQTSQAQLRLLLEKVTQDHTDLTIILETTTTHGDMIEEYTHNLSIRDPLTGLFNRRYQEKSLIRHLQVAKQHQQPLCLIMVDIDYFKRFNDKWGHHAGDRVLRGVSQFLLHNIRPSDVACRYGGEELLLILPGTPLSEAERLAERLRIGVKQLSLHHPQQFLDVITISLGVSCFPEHGECCEDIIYAADAALYEAKALGRNRIVTAQAVKMIN